MSPSSRRLSTAAWAAALGLALIGTTAAPTGATPPPTSRTLDWQPCRPEPGDTPDELEALKGSECATLTVPVDWNNPAGDTFGLAVARRVAQGNRVGSLVFGPGGPGDSGVGRIRTGMSRFTATLKDRFDIVSFDPRGVGRSAPVLCSASLLAEQPSPVITSQAEYDRTLRINRELDDDCRRHTGPVYDHLDSGQTVHDLEALRSALGDRQLTFHGSSYGTLLGAQYAETFPHRVRAIVLESVTDHSIRDAAEFLDTQAWAQQDSFDEFVRWCDTDPRCVLHNRDVRTVWTDLLARADRGELPDPQNPKAALTSHTLSFFAMKKLKDPDWAGLAGILRQLEQAKPPVVEPPKPPTGLRPAPFTVFCQDWDLSVRSYREYAGHLRRLAQRYPDAKYVASLIAVSSCLGRSGQVDNPQHRLKVRGVEKPLLLVNSLHDPATGHNWATSVARQLGRNGVLLTDKGWGHGNYSVNPCLQAKVDAYLVAGRVPPRGSTCPAVRPTSG